MSDIVTAIATEKDRLIKHRAQLTAQVTELEGAIASVDHELHAITVYETARTGKAPRGSKRDTILAIIKENAGISRGGIIDVLKAQGHDRPQVGLSNTLNALKKASRITANDGKYTLASSI